MPHAAQRTTAQREALRRYNESNGRIDDARAMLNVRLSQRAPGAPRGGGERKESAVFGTHAGCPFGSLYTAGAAH